MDEDAPRAPDEPDDAAVAARPPEAEAQAAPLGPVGLLTTFAVGLGMGTADTVPGFSGGTVALLAGVYERLIANVRQGARALALLLRGRLGDGARAVVAIEWRFVLPLLVGMGTAIVTLAGALSGLLETRPQQLSSVFLGLVLGATVVAAGDLRRPDVRLAAVGVVAAVVTFVALGLAGGTAQDPALLAFVAAGAVAICAMILPGISGAFLLVLLGMYQPVIDAVDQRALEVLGVLALGCLIGLASFATLLNWLLREHHDVVLAAMLGLMVGSSRVLWPWPGTEVGDPTLGAPLMSGLPVLAGLAVAAFVAIVLAGHVARRATRR